MVFKHYGNDCAYMYNIIWLGNGWISRHVLLSGCMSQYSGKSPYSTMCHINSILLFHPTPIFVVWYFLKRKKKTNKKSQNDNIKNVKENQNQLSVLACYKLAVVKPHTEQQLAFSVVKFLQACSPLNWVRQRNVHWWQNKIIFLIMVSCRGLRHIQSSAWGGVWEDGP